MQVDMFDRNLCDSAHILIQQSKLPSSVILTCPRFLYISVHILKISSCFCCLKIVHKIAF